MAITNKGGFDDLEAQEQEENLGTRRKIGFGKPAPPVEFSAEEPPQETGIDDNESPLLLTNENGRALGVDARS
jgi:hypothetical protein